MIADLIQSDHRAGRELFAAVGNAPQQAWAEREGEMRALAGRWQAHTAMLEQAVLRRLPADERVTSVAEGSRRVAAMADDLARRAPQRDADHRWLADFETLRALFDTQCGREETVLLPLIRDVLAGPDLAALNEEVARLRGAA